MGWNTQVITARLVIITNDGGLFVYDGDPAPQRLIISIAGAAGADQWGNGYPAGFMCQTPEGVLQATIADGLITVSEGTEPGVAIGPAGIVTGNLNIDGTTDQITAGPWKAMALQHGWATAPGGQAARYRLAAAPGGDIELQADLSPGTTADGTLIATLDPAYQPAVTQPIPLILVSGTPDTINYCLLLSPDGELTCQGLAGMTSSDQVSVRALAGL